MTTEKESEVLRSPRVSQLAATMAALGGGLLAIATIVGFSLHLAGHVAHATYLSALGVEPDLFPQSADWKVIQGYYAVILQGFKILSEVPWSLVLMLFLGIALAILITSLPSEQPAIHRWLQRQPRWIREIIFALVGSISSLAMLISAASFVLLIAIVPGLIGERSGMERAQEIRASLLKSEPINISEIWRNGQLGQRGVIVAISADLLSIYDFDSKTIRTIDRKGAELRRPLVQEPPRQ